MRQIKAELTNCTCLSIICLLPLKVNACPTANKNKDALEQKAIHESLNANLEKLLLLVKSAAFFKKKRLILIFFPIHGRRITDAFRFDCIDDMGFVYRNHTQEHLSVSLYTVSPQSHKVLKQSISSLSSSSMVEHFHHKSLLKKAQKHTCRYSGADDPRDIRSHRMHEQMVFRVSLSTDPL